MVGRKITILFNLLIFIIFGSGSVTGAPTVNTINKDSSIEEIREVLATLNIPVFDFKFENSEFPTYEVINHPEDCMGVSIINNEYVKGSLVITEGNEILYDSGEYEEKESGVRLKYRGNTSTASETMKKKSFKIKLSKKADLLFRDDKEYKDKDWLLLGNASSGLKFLVGSTVGSLCGMEWEPSCRHVCVIMNDTYMGTFLLTEAVNRADKRVNIDKSGFIVENDAYWWKPDEVYFKSQYLPYATGWTFKEPDTDDFEEDTFENIKGVIDTFEDALYSNQDIDEMYDKESFANWILAHEILGNSDGMGSNMFVMKENFNPEDWFETKLKMGPLWDFDGCFNTVDDHVLIFDSSYFWYQQLFLYSDFYEYFLERFNAVKDNILNELNDIVLKYINENPDIYSARVLDYKFGYIGNSSRVQPLSDFNKLKTYIENRIPRLEELYQIIPAKKLLLKESSEEITVGDTMQLIASVLPGNATDIDIKWLSSNSNVAEVDSTGLLNAKKPGECRITVKSGSLWASRDLIVKPKYAESVTLDREDIEILIGETLQLNATVFPEDTTDKTILWSSSDGKIANVDGNGVVTGLKEGNVIITARCDEEEAACEIKVKKPIVKAEKIILSEDNIVIIIRGETLKMGAKIYPEDTTDKTIEWSTTDPAIIEISPDGILEAVSIGEAQITAKCNDISVSCPVAVIRHPVEFLELSDSEATIFNEYKLIAKIGPETAGGTDIKLSLSNDLIEVIDWQWEDEAQTVCGINLRNPFFNVGMTKLTVKCGDLAASCLLNVMSNSSVDTIIDTCQKISIYSIDGILIKRDCDPEELRRLSQGIYLILTEREIIKIVL